MPNATVLLLADAARKALLATIIAAEPAATTLALKSVKEPVACAKAEIDVIAAVNRDGKAAQAVTATKCAEHDCHACGAYIGVVPFTHDGSGGASKLTGTHVRYAEFGQWGDAGGIPAVVRLGEGLVGIRFEVGSMGQGIASEGTTIYELDPDGSLREVFNASQDLDDEAAGCGKKDALPCFKATFNVDLGKRVVGAHVVIETRLKGTDLAEGGKKAVPVDRKTTYEYDGKKYVVVPAAKK